MLNLGSHSHKGYHDIESHGFSASPEVGPISNYSLYVSLGCPVYV